MHHHHNLHANQQHANKPTTTQTTQTNSELVKAESLGRLHYGVELASDSDLTVWRIRLPPDAFDADLPGGRDLREDLARLGRETGGHGGHVMMEARFPDNASRYPSEPFKLRVVVSCWVVVELSSSGFFGRAGSGRVGRAAGVCVPFRETNLRKTRNPYNNLQNKQNATPPKTTHNITTVPPMPPLHRPRHRWRRHLHRGADDVGVAGVLAALDVRRVHPGARHPQHGRLRAAGGADAGRAAEGEWCAGG